MASCEDLLLCCNSLTFQRDYFIVNPFTHQWLALPPTLHQHMYVLFGFVCDPSSVAEAREGGQLRYRVVRIAVPLAEYKKEFNVEIFSSEDGQWKEYVMTSVEATRTRWWSHRGVSCNGILYWQFYFGRGKVMRLDPFNPNREICTIESAPDMWRVENLASSLALDLAPLDLMGRPDEPKKYVIGICGGKLKMSEMVLFHAHLDDISFFNIWEMEDGESEWRMVKVVPLKEIILANPLIVPPTTLGVNACRPLAFHPTDENIIYLESYVMSNVICCNSKMRSVEIVDGYEFNQWFYMNADAFPFFHFCCRIGQPLFPPCRRCE